MNRIAEVRWSLQLSFAHCFDPMVPSGARKNAHVVHHLWCRRKMFGRGEVLSTLSPILQTRNIGVLVRKIDTLKWKKVVGYTVKRLLRIAARNVGMRA